MTQVTDHITGHIEQLTGERIVFVGGSPNHPNATFLGFRNSEGEDTYLVLSKEAADALGKLLTRPFKGERTTYPHKTIWRVAKEGEMHVEI